MPNNGYIAVAVHNILGEILEELNLYNIKDGVPAKRLKLSISHPFSDMNLKAN